MIRVLYALRKSPHLSVDEFHDYWLNTHGPLVVANADVLAIDRYIQVHTIDDPNSKAARKARGMVELYDGVSELWIDNTDDPVAAWESAEGESALREIVGDEDRFVDASRSSLWTAIDLPQVNPVPEDIVATPDSSRTKFFYVLHRLPNLSLEEFQLYWRMNHGPLIRKMAVDMRVLRYIQVHTIDNRVCELARAARGEMEVPYDGHAELWFDTEDQAASAGSPERARASQAAAEDEAKFIDFSRSSYWIGKEHVLFSRR